MGVPWDAISAVSGAVAAILAVLTYADRKRGMRDPDTAPPAWDPAITRAEQPARSGPTPEWTHPRVIDPAMARVDLNKIRRRQPRNRRSGLLLWGFWIALWTALMATLLWYTTTRR